MDPSKLIEARMYNPQWFAAQHAEYGNKINYLNRFGTKDPSRLPKRNGHLPICFHSRHQQSLKQLNVSTARYHLPSGMEHAVWHDLYGVYNSTPKPHAGYIDQPIRVNPGIWDTNTLGRTG